MRRARPGLQAVGAAVAATLLVACTASPPTTGAKPRPTVGAGVAFTAAAAVPPGAWGQDRLAAAQALMQARLTALDEAGPALRQERWLARVEGATLRSDQARILAHMRSIGVEGVVLRAMKETEAPKPSASGADVSWGARATLEYRIKGYDDAPRTFTLDLTFRATPGGPEGTTVLIGSRPGERPEPWDLPAMTIQRSHTALVISSGDRPIADELARRASRAGRAVAAVLGSAEPAVWVVPANDAEAAALLGRTSADLVGLAATVDGPIGPGRPAGADRIVVVPSAWDALTGAGRDVILRHELTHATTRRTSTRQPPLWLSEGLAEFVAYRGVDLPEREVVAPALERVRANGLPRALPDAADFATSSGLDAVYGLSLLAARTIADGHGVAALVALFRSANGDGRDAPSAGTKADTSADTRVEVSVDRIIDRYLVEHLGTDRDGLAAAWRARISGLLRS